MGAVKPAGGWKMLSKGWIAMPLTVEPPAAVAEFFIWIERKRLDPEAWVLPYFRGSLFALAQEAIFYRDDSGSQISFGIISLHFPRAKDVLVPSVLGTYTLPEHRGHGLGTQVLARAIERLSE